MSDHLMECYRCGAVLDSVLMWSLPGDVEYCEDCFAKLHPEEYAKEKSDPVDHPDHYRWLPVEVIEITEHFNFRLGNALKYIMRADHKGKPVEDLRKARWYLDREIASRLADESSV